MRQKGDCLSLQGFCKVWKSLNINLSLVESHVVLYHLKRLFLFSFFSLFAFLQFKKGCNTAMIKLVCAAVYFDLVTTKPLTVAPSFKILFRILLFSWTNPSMVSCALPAATSLILMCRTLCGSFYRLKLQFLHL